MRPGSGRSRRRGSFLVACVAAFVTIAGNRLNHHDAFAVVRRVDSSLLHIGLLVRFTVSFNPVPTAFSASALAAGPFSPAARIAAVVVYGRDARRAARRQGAER